MHPPRSARSVLARSASSCPRLLAFGLILASSAASQAGTLTFGTSAPTGGAAAISSWTGATFDADNVGGSGVNANGGSDNGATNDGTTYVAGNRPVQGQTFTTGSNAGGYLLTSVTVRMQGYTNNTASGSNIGGYDLNDTNTALRLRVGRIDGSVFVPFTQETAACGGSGNPGQGGTANGPGTYLTFTLGAPIVLAPNTVYGFDFGTTGDYFEMLGIRGAASGGNPYAGGTAYTSGANGYGSNAVTTQSGERAFLVDMTTYTAPTPGTFVHPGLLHTDADFERMRTKVAAGAQPWADGWGALTSNGRAQLGTAPRPLQTVIRGGDGQNFTQMYIDIARAYQLALRWKVSGDTAYADQAVVFLNAWSSTMTGLTGNSDRFLASGIYGYEWANVGEIMRTYPGWAAADVTAFQNLLVNIFYPMNHDFLVNHNGAAITNYWANWDLCNMASMLSIGVFCDRTDIYNEAVDYFYNGKGNGSVSKFVYQIHPGNLGQWQESGRDQGHTTFGISLVGPICEMAWNQGLDFYGFDNNRFLAGSEYVAKYNLGYDVPFQGYAWGTGTSGTWQFQGVVSNAARGILRPCWAMVYNHYVNRKGIASPYTGGEVTANQPEGDGGNGDQLGFGTLTFSRDPIATGQKPSGLAALEDANSIQLNWWGAAYATSYNVKRATTSGGPYTTIATGVTDLLTYTDSGLAPGTYYYVVTGTTPSGETAVSNEARAVSRAELHTWLKMDETTGTTAADASNHSHAGTLVNGPTWTTGKTGNAISFDGTDDYVSLPTSLVRDLDDFTVSTWVYLNANNTWSRIFDFGDSNGRGMYLTTKNGGGVVSFGSYTVYSYNTQTINGTAALPTAQWVHVAVSVSGKTGTLYVNGVAVGQNTSLDYQPFQLGQTRGNYLGKSNWADPYLNGKLDDFRIYRGALNADEVRTLAASGTAHLEFDEASGTTATDITGNGWNGTLVNGPLWSTSGKIANAVDLDGSNDHVTLPTGVVNGLTTASISTWVNLDTVSNWSRVFDFGTGTTTYMFLTPKNGNTGTVRFAISTGGGGGEQKIDGTAAITTGGWHHVAVTLNGATGTLYVDGVQVGQNTAMTLTPSSLGATTQNRIGRSQYNDPYLDGRVDDFRIFGRALTATEVSALAGTFPAPSSPAAAAGNNSVALSWAAVSGASSYQVRRSTTSGGPYTTIAVGLTGTSWTDGSAVNGTTYYYVIAATTPLGESVSTQLSALPLPPIPAAPTGLALNGWNGAVALSWTASSGATSYTVKRGTSSGTYTQSTTGLTATTWSDTTAVDGTTYYYVVSASNLGGESANSSEVSVLFTQPRAYLKFDETTGLTAADASGNAWQGTLVNGPLWSAGRSNNTVDLDGTDDHVTLPTGVVNGVTGCTVMLWANLDSVSTWQRLFDFGTGTSVYMFLTPKNGANGNLRFAISTAGGGGEQKIDGTAPFPAGGWHHVAVTLAGATGTLYVDGVQVGQNTAMTLTPTSLGSTTKNYLGRSQYADPYLVGRIDEFRLYNRALTSTEVASLVATSPLGLMTAPTGPTATAGTTQVALAWTAPTGATGYDVLRSTVAGGPYSVVSTNQTAVSYTDTGLTTGTTYYYVVVARSATSESPDSAEVSAAAQ
ncbi:LamG-like jellyroll fold domain-containing protein [Luteolibacter sp. LG18]|uniref:LamG-like jellyroll fold domain-containing protein n=1 Tax=Luteolibacter sp. LG18 TaxID=2819286 RepID=UPI002B27C89D|nr:hypothetical protein llg_08280 [Luteolibacter sp. LG18]